MALFQDAKEILDNGSNKQVKAIKDSNGNIIWGSQSAFPYRRLEYIHFSGIDEYIQMDFTMSTKNRKYHIIFDINDQTEGKVLLGQQDTSVSAATRRIALVRNGGSNTLNWCIGNTWGTGLSVSANTKYDATFVYTNASSNTLVVDIKNADGTSLISETKTGTATSIANLGNGIFGAEKYQNSQISNYWNGKMYYFEKYVNSTNVLQNKQYPVQRKSDGVCGLYDVITNTFYPMTGTNITNAAAGPVVDEYWDLTNN